MNQEDPLRQSENQQRIPETPPPPEQIAALEARLVNAQVRIMGLLGKIQELEAEIRRLEEFNRSFPTPPPAS